MSVAATTTWATFIACGGGTGFAMLRM